MRHYLQKMMAPPSDQAPLIRQTYLIIDSKIQYIDYQIQKYFENCTCSISASKENTDADDKGLVQNLDKILIYVDTLRSDLELLQILKVWLKEETVDDIIILLKDNAYAEYSPEKLEELLKQKAIYLLRMRAEC